jgi:hypothetical protein
MSPALQNHHFSSFFIIDIRPVTSHLLIVPRHGSYVLTSPLTCILYPRVSFSGLAGQQRSNQLRATNTTRHRNLLQRLTVMDVLDGLTCLWHSSLTTMSHPTNCVHAKHTSAHRRARILNRTSLHSSTSVKDHESIFVRCRYYTSPIDVQ